MAKEENDRVNWKIIVGPLLTKTSRASISHLALEFGSPTFGPRRLDPDKLDPANWTLTIWTPYKVDPEQFGPQLFGPHYKLDPGRNGATELKLDPSTNWTLLQIGPQ